MDAPGRSVTAEQSGCSSRTRRSVLVGATVCGLTAVAGCLGGQEADAGSDVVASAPLPSDPDNHTYPQMGGDGPTVTYYGNWKCPACAEFSTGSDRVLALGTVVSEYIESNRLRLRYRSLAYRPNGEPFLGADAVRAARAGLAVWDLEPDSFWRFYETVMANQPAEGDNWATTDRLMEFAQTAGVESLDAVREAVEDGGYQQAVRESAQAARDAGITGTPQLIIDGSIYSPFNAADTREALDTLAD